MNKRMKEKIESAVKEICEHSLFKDRLYYLCCGELSMASPETPVIYVYDPKYGYPSAEKMDMRLMKENYACIKTFEIQKTYKQKTSKI